MSKSCNVIPLAPVRAAIRSWEARQGEQYSDFATRQSFHGMFGDGANHEHVVLPMKPMQSLAAMSEVKPDTLYNLRDRKGKKWVDFDLADKIITTIDPMLWHCDPELAKVYKEFDFTKLDERRPTTEAA